MNKEKAQYLKIRRNSYIRKIQNDIQKVYPRARFNVSRGPGLRQATIRVYVPLEDPLDVFDALEEGFLGDAAANNFHFYILPSVLESR